MSYPFGHQYRTYDIYPEKIEDFSTLLVGDHLVVQDTGTYYTHGIVTSISPIEVVDFSGVVQPEAKIRTVNLKQFMNKTTDLLIRINHKRRLSGNETAQRAKEMADDKEKKWKTFIDIADNCEPFATNCVTGYEYSSRVSTFIDSMLRASISGISGMAQKPYE